MANWRPAAVSQLRLRPRWASALLLVAFNSLRLSMSCPTRRLQNTLFRSRGEGPRKVHFEKSLFVSPDMRRGRRSPTASVFLGCCPACHSRGEFHPEHAPTCSRGGGAPTPATSHSHTLSAPADSSTFSNGSSFRSASDQHRVSPHASQLLTESPTLAPTWLPHQINSRQGFPR